MSQVSDTTILYGGKLAEGFTFDGKFVATRGLEQFIVYKLSSQAKGTVRKYVLNNPFPILIVAVRTESSQIGTVDYTIYDANDSVLYTGEISGNNAYYSLQIPIPVNSKIVLDTNGVYDIQEPAIIARRISVEVIPIVGAVV